MSRLCYSLVAIVAGNLWANTFAQAAAGCKLAKLAEFPVTMVGLRPVIPAKINGAEAQFIVDSGAFYSTMSTPTARRFNLPLSALPFSYRIIGVGGDADVSLGMVKNFDMAGIPIRDIGFLVGGTDIGADGLLGQNVLGIGDVEYDLARGTVRIIRPNEECSNATLAYWVAPGEAYSVMPITYATKNNPHTIGAVFLNGLKIQATFDTGAGQSMLSTRAAERAGIKIDSPGVKAIGYSHGLGSKTLMTYLASFGTLKIGDEEIDHAQLRFGDLGVDTDMLIGADFFLSHHVYVSNKQHRLYFTYNGGPIFDLRPQAAPGTGTPPQPAKTTTVAATTIAAATATATAEQTTSPADGSGSATPKEPSVADRTKAAELSRRGTASLARHDHVSALADLNEACELAPAPEYFVQRGAVYQAMQQPRAAMADYDKALLLHPNDGAALFARADLRARTGDKAGAANDYDALSKLLSPNDNDHLWVADGYRYIEHWRESLDHYNIWIAAHDIDGKKSRALEGRCASRAYLHTELPAAIKDCDRALKTYLKNDVRMAVVYAYRGLAYLQEGDYGRSIADYSTALKLKENDGDSLYGRAMGELRMGQLAAGNADLAAALAHDSTVGDRFKKYGITPPP